MKNHFIKKIATLSLCIFFQGSIQAAAEERSPEKKDWSFQKLSPQEKYQFYEDMFRIVDRKYPNPEDRFKGIYLEIGIKLKEEKSSKK